jgi:hypothetical protein
MNRRTALQLGASLGVMAGAGFYGGYRLLPPRPSRVLEPVDILARRFYSSLDAEQRSRTCVDYDHPLRQYHNRVWGGGESIVFGFNRRQRATLTDLLYAGLSEQGRERIPEEYFTRWTVVHLTTCRRRLAASRSGGRVLCCVISRSATCGIMLSRQLVHDHL